MGRRAIYTAEERRKREKDSKKRYRQSTKGVAKQREHNSRPNAKANREKWNATPKGQQALRQGHRRYSAKRLEWVQQEKVKRGCVDCGYNQHPAGLDFDHVTGDKCFEISKVKRSLEKLKEEIDKCVVRCAICHRIKTFNEQRNRGLDVEGVEKHDRVVNPERSSEQAPEEHW